ncbi:hypothetical protein HDU76_004712 [Blyttiomyces sp. JEL0837]|nr:hypothetical protein HDU76_004712 [Blyttiomyces sp. JEL0837]
MILNKRATLGLDIDGCISTSTTPKNASSSPSTSSPPPPFQVCSRDYRSRRSNFRDARARMLREVRLQSRREDSENLDSPALVMENIGNSGEDLGDGGVGSSSGSGVHGVNAGESLNGNETAGSSVATLNKSNGGGGLELFSGTEEESSVEMSDGEESESLGDDHDDDDEEEDEEEGLGEHEREDEEEEGGIEEEESEEESDRHEGDGRVPRERGERIFIDVDVDDGDDDDDIFFDDGNGFYDDYFEGLFDSNDSDPSDDSDYSERESESERDEAESERMRILLGTIAAYNLRPRNSGVVDDHVGGGGYRRVSPRDGSDDDYIEGGNDKGEIDEQIAPSLVASIVDSHRTTITEDELHLFEWSMEARWIRNDNLGKVCCHKSDSPQGRLWHSDIFPEVMTYRFVRTGGSQYYHRSSGGGTGSGNNDGNGNEGFRGRRMIRAGDRVRVASYPALSVSRERKGWGWVMRNRWVTIRSVGKGGCGVVPRENGECRIAIDDLDEDQGLGFAM